MGDMITTADTVLTDTLIDAVRAALLRYPAKVVAQVAQVPSGTLAQLANSMRVYGAPIHGQPRVWLACHLATDFRLAVAADMIARWALREAIVGIDLRFEIHSHDGLYTSLSWES